MTATHSFHDLPPEAFPLIIRAFSRSTGDEVWTSGEIAQAGAYFVPPLIETFGPVRIRIEFGDGSVVDDGVLIL